MAIQTKTLAAGATVLGGSAAVGVGISKITSEKDIPVNTQIKAKLASSNFSSDESNEECLKALKKEEYSESNYRLAVVACSSQKDFSKRAEYLGLTVLTETNKGEDGWSTWWTSDKEKVQKIATTTKDKNTWTGDAGAQDLLVTFCTSDQNNKKISKDSKNNDWYNFLTACTKDKTGSTAIKTDLLKKDLWTNQFTIRSKMKDADFAEKVTPTTECNDQVDKEYTEEAYKLAVEQCAKSNTFKERAEELNLMSLDTSNKGEADWNSWWTTNHSTIKPLVTTVSTLTTWEPTNGAQTPLATYCDSKNSTKITKDTNDSDWKNYLKACTKDKTGSAVTTREGFLTKDFWTGATSSAAA